MILGDHAERSLGADDRAEEVGAVRVERLAAQLDDLPVGQDERQPGDVMRREAVLQAVRASGILGDVPADRAHLLARRIGRVEEAFACDGARDVEVRDARLDDDPLAVEVDLQDPVHPRERDDYPARHRRRSTGQAGAGAAGDEGHALARACPKHGLDVLRRAGQDDELRHRAMSGQAVALVDAELLGLGDDVLGAERRLQLGDEGGGQAHTASLARHDVRVGCAARALSK